MANHFIAKCGQQEARPKAGDRKPKMERGSLERSSIPVEDANGAPIFHRATENYRRDAFRSRFPDLLGLRSGVDGDLRAPLVPIAAERPNIPGGCAAIENQWRPEVAIHPGL